MFLCWIFLICANIFERLKFFKGEVQVIRVDKYCLIRILLFQLLCDANDGIVSYSKDNMSWLVSFLCEKSDRKVANIIFEILIELLWSNTPFWFVIALVVIVRVQMIDIVVWSKISVFFEQFNQRVKSFLEIPLDLS